MSMLLCCHRKDLQCEPGPFASSASRQAFALVCQRRLEREKSREEISQYQRDADKAWEDLFSPSALGTLATRVAAIAKRQQAWLELMKSNRDVPLILSARDAGISAANPEDDDNGNDICPVGSTFSDGVNDLVRGTNPAAVIGDGHGSGRRYTFSPVGRGCVRECDEDIHA